MKDKSGVGYLMNALGGVFLSGGNYDSSRYYYQQAFRIRTEISDKPGIAWTEKNLGLLNEKTENTGDAENCYKRSLILFEEIEDKWGTAFVTNRLGYIFLLKKDLAKAENYLNRSLKLSKELGYPSEISNAAGSLWKLYSAKKDWKNALTMYELHVQMHDSISNQETKKAAIKNQLKYEYDKKSTADSVKNAELQKVKDAQLAAQNASLKQERTQRYALYGGLILIAGFFAFVFNRFRVIQKQKQVIENQKVLVDKAYETLHEKNKEVLDSIYYARRIQRALVTSEKYIEKNLKRLVSKN
jgi:tetratricopeptide (TPR) repeat protein